MVKDEVFEGDLVYWNNSKGYGFISYDNETEIFCHASGLVNGTVPVKGMRVQFVIGANRGRPIAKEVTQVEYL